MSRTAMEKKNPYHTTQFMNFSQDPNTISSITVYVETVYVEAADTVKKHIHSYPYRTPVH